MREEMLEKDVGFYHLVVKVMKDLCIDLGQGHSLEVGQDLEVGQEVDPEVGQSAEVGHDQLVVQG